MVQFEDGSTQTLVSRLPTFQEVPAIMMITGPVYRIRCRKSSEPQSRISCSLLDRERKGQR